MSSNSIGAISPLLAWQPGVGVGNPPVAPSPSRTEVIGAPATNQPAGTPTEGKQLVPQNPPTAPAASPAGSMMFLLLPILLLVGLMVFGSMSQRKEQRKKLALLNSIERNDRVQTIGGVIGTVAEIAGDEIVLRVDEASNTRVRFARAAIQQVLRKANAPAAAGSATVAEAKLPVVKAGV